MPNFRRIGPYRLHFWSADRKEPAHIHVECDDKTAKFWLNPVRLASSRHFGKRDLAKLARIVIEHELEITRRWHEHFGH